MIAAGLCDRCRHRRDITSDRGSRFVLCLRSREDPSFPRYPRLPVLACRGFEPELAGAAGPGAGHDDGSAAGAAGRGPEDG